MVNKYLQNFYILINFSLQFILKKFFSRQTVTMKILLLFLVACFLVFQISVVESRPSIVSFLHDVVDTTASVKKNIICLVDAVAGILLPHPKSVVCDNNQDTYHNKYPANVIKREDGCLIEKYTGILLLNQKESCYNY